MFAKMADTVMKHSKVVIAIWLVVVLCSVPFMLKVDSVYEYDMTKMTGSDSESAQGNAIMEEKFSNAINMSLVLVIGYDAGNETQVDTLADEINNILKAKYGTGDNAVTITSVGSYGDDGTPVRLYSVASANPDFEYANETKTIRNVVSQAKEVTGIGLTTYVTGDAALTYDTMDSANGDIEKIDPLSVAIIFVLLALFFGALATAVVPPIGFGVAYAISMLAMYLFGSMTTVFYLTSTLMMVTMLGAGCDYGIFIITRYREELKKGADHHEALKTAIEWAGESVFTSGMSVIIGFACLAICDFSLVRNMGIMLAIGIVFALVSALTFTPAVINLIGEKIFWPNNVAKYQGVDNGTNTGIYAKASKFFAGYFKWVARFTRKYAKAIVCFAIIISVPSVYVYATSESSYDMISVEPDGEAKEGLFAIMDETYGGTLMPTYAVVEFNDTVVTEMGKATIGSETVPYVIWNSYGLTATTSGYTGCVPAIMKISTEITAKNDIVATASGLNSWATLFYTAVHTYVYEQAKAANPDAGETAWKAYADANTNTVITTLTEDQVYNFNRAVVALMPSAVKAYVGALVDNAHQVAVTYPTVSLPDLQLGASASGTPVTLANAIDGVLNLGTGLISDDGKAVSIMIVTKEKPMSDNTMAFVKTIQDAFHGNGGYDETYPTVIKESYISGQNALISDISETVGSQFNIIQVVVIILLLILLFVILGCYLTPIRAMVCIMLSVIWTLALTFVVFQDILDIPVCWIVPIVLFVVLLGLGMDYDIFMTTRIRENKIRGMSNDDAIDAAITSASGTISLCALIMGGTFLTLLVGSSSMLQEFGFALGIGILIDGLFMVTFVGPAAMHLMGDWSWKGPAFLQRKHGDQ